MSQDLERDRWARLALEHMSQGRSRTAIDAFKRALGADPDWSQGHALLAVCLLEVQRLHAAELEARRALSLEPTSASAHHALGLVLVARRRFPEAEEHLLAALEQEPQQTEHHAALASLRDLTGRSAEAEQLLVKALEMEPDDPSLRVRLGELRLSRGRVADAEALAQEALSMEAGDSRGLVLMGRLRLRQGRVEEAREAAIEALRNEPEGRDALRLLVEIKGHTSLFLGLWWRFNVWMSSLGSGGSTLVLLTAYALYRSVTILLQGEREDVANLVQYGWLGLVAYTWVAPAMFQRMLAKELGKIQLDPEF